MRLTSFLLLLISAVASAQSDSKPQYIRVGNPHDVVTKPQPGIALMGGGKDQDAAFQWMCQKAHGGDFVILRASGTDAYNPYVQKLCPELNSVATLVIHSRDAANDPVAREALHRAEAIFIAGGDQSNYVKFWGGTAVTEEINAAAKRGVPIGGTSAGLAVLGEYSYSAMNDTVQSADALANPFHERITIEHNFLKLPQLQHVITDSHFAKRDRMGRSVAFVARIYKNGDHDVRGIGIDERSAVLLEPNGQAKVVGEGEGAYMLSPAELRAYNISPGKPLRFAVTVQHVRTNETIGFKSWTAPQAEHYTLTADDGKLTSSKAMARFTEACVLCGSIRQFRSSALLQSDVTFALVNTFGFTPAEFRFLRSLKTPAGIQRFIDEVPYHLAATSWSPRLVIRERTAHCLEGAIFGAAALRAIGFPPLVFDLEADRDTDHVVAIYKVRGHWGAIAKSNYTGCRWRDPVFRNLRELAMSYFDVYFNLRGERTLRNYSQPVDLSRFDDQHWMTKEGSVWCIAEHLCHIPHTPLLRPWMAKSLQRLDKRSFDAGTLGLRKH